MGVVGDEWHQTPNTREWRKRTKAAPAISEAGIAQEKLDANDSSGFVTPPNELEADTTMQADETEEQGDATTAMQREESQGPTMPGGHIHGLIADPSDYHKDGLGKSNGARELIMASLRLPSLLGLEDSASGYTGFLPWTRETEADGSTRSAAEKDHGTDKQHGMMHMDADSPGSEEFELVEKDQVKEDYFSYPAQRKSHRSWRPRSKSKRPRASVARLVDDHDDLRFSSPAHSDVDETWSIIDEEDHSVKNGAPEFHPSAPSSTALSKTLHELDEVEINEFLNHFSRHTREVHLPGAVKHFLRMPQWSDFVYSSDEEEEEGAEPFAPSAGLADRHRRSRLLTHVDRGLHRLEKPEMVEGVTLSSSTGNLLSSKEKEGRLSEPIASSKVQDLPTSAAKELPMVPNPMESNVRGSIPATPTDATPIHTPLSYDSDTNLDNAPPFTDITFADDKPLPHHTVQKKDVTGISSEIQEEHVDGVAYCIAYFLALVEQYAPDDLDEAPVTEYRESRARSHVERLYIIAPFWEQLAIYLRALYSWEDSRRTAAAAMIYFVLWYTELIPTAFFLTLFYYVLQFRYFPQDESLLHQRVHERMVRGQHANRLAERLKRRSRLDILDLYKRWASTYGVFSQVATGDVADFHEKIKNLLLWRNPKASQRTALLLFLLVIFTMFCSAALVLKTFFFGLGFTFFALMPLQTLYPRYRRALNPLWWAVLGSPTDAQWAVQLLRQRHARYQDWLLANTDSYKASKSGGASGSDTPHSPGGASDMPKSYFKRRDPANHAAKQKEERQWMDKRKLDSFLCQHYGVPGHLVVTPTHMYFSPVRVVGSSGKHYVTRLEDMIGLRKTHHNRLWLWDSHGLKITRRHKNSLILSNMARRDEAFNLLLTMASHHMEDM